jgi:predicted CoA-binding protein
MEETCEVPAYATTTDEIKDILTSVKTIAIVGLSPKKERESNKVASYLQNEGYRIIPVNPKHNEILGLKSYASLHDITEEIDVVDIFRRPSAVTDIVDSAIQKNVKVIWMQEGIINNEAAKKGKNAGLKVVMNKCMMKEHIKMTRQMATSALKKDALVNSESK